MGGGYSGGENVTVTEDAIKAQRGEQLKIHQEKVLDLKDEIQSLEAEKKVLINLIESRQKEYEKAKVDGRANLESSLKELKDEEAALRSSLEKYDKIIDERKSQAQQTKADFTDWELALIEREQKVEKSEVSLDQKIDAHNKNVTAFEQRENAFNIMADKFQKQNQVDLDKITQAKGELQQKADEAQLVLDNSIAAKKEVDQQNEQLQATIFEADSKIEALKIAEADKQKFEADKVALDEEKTKLKSWHVRLQAEEGRLDTLSRSLQVADANIKKRQKIVEQAEQGQPPVQ